LVNETIELEKEVRELAKDKKIKYNELKLFLENQSDLKIQSLIIQDRLSKLPPTGMFTVIVIHLY
jgi:hypothetical protein